MIITISFRELPVGGSAAEIASLVSPVSSLGEVTVTQNGHSRYRV